MSESTEEALRRDWDARAYDRVATRAIEAYGSEIIGVLVVQMRSSADALEAYSMFTEDLWRGLPGFQWRCSFRAWAHTLARNAAARWRAARARWLQRNVPLSEVDESSAVAACERTRTAAHLCTEVEAAMRDLRDELSDGDRALLVLRIEKRMRWREIAIAMSDAALSDAQVTREAARLRKRLQIAAERLRALARSRGLLGAEGGPA